MSSKSHVTATPKVLPRISDRISLIKDPPGPRFDSPRVLSPRNKTRSKLVSGVPAEIIMALLGPEYSEQLGHTLSTGAVVSGGNSNVHRNQATDKCGSNPSLRVCGWRGGVGTNWTGGGAFKGVERSPSCRARHVSDPQRGRRALHELG